MINQMHDIHNTNSFQYHNCKLLMHSEYRYDLVNFPEVKPLLDSQISKYFYLFSTENNYPYTVFVDIIPHDILDIIQISLQDVHFHYLGRKFDNKPFSEYSFKIHEHLTINKSNNNRPEKYFARIKNQIYQHTSTKKSVAIDEINLLLFLIDRANFYNESFSQPLSFHLQREIFTYLQFQMYEIEKNGLDTDNYKFNFKYLRKLDTEINYELARNLLVPANYRKHKFEKDNAK